MFEDRELIGEFVNESREHLADIESQLLDIEAGGANADPKLVNEVFRAIHSIKGAAGFMGFVTLGKLAHELESVLNLVRMGQLVPTSPIIDILLKAADKLRNMIDDIDNSNQAEIADHLEALELIVAGLIAAESPVTQHAPRATDIAAPMPTDPQSLLVPATDVAAPARSFAAPQPASTTTAPRPAASEGATSNAAPADNSIRVGIGVLDRLMTLAGELVLSRNQLLQTLNSKEYAKLDAVSARVNQVTSDLHETVMRARMQVVGTIFNRFPRVVRDLSSQLGKQCELKIEGGEVELDKSIIEAIGDPLTHLIRNSVDHGIEMPEQRRTANKPIKALVVMTAFHQSGKVNITISDDGRGIDADNLRQKAVSKGLISAEQARAMNERDSLNLIFRPGFSTAEKLTDVSGRGVGMDVVKTNIERVGGSVWVETEVGRGTTVHVRLPLTLAIIPSLIVHTAGNRYAIPQSSISELVRVKRSEVATKIQRLKSAEVLRLRGTLLPLVRLKTVLGIGAAHDEHDKASAHNIVVVDAGPVRFGLVVDGLHDPEEIVVRPLGRHMRNCTLLSGATILGDGQAALILDSAGIAAFTGMRSPEDDGRGAAADASATVNTDTHQLILFQNDPSEQFAIPLQLVARLERVRANQIDQIGGRKALRYRGGVLPLLVLDQYIDAQPMPESAWMHVVVFVMGGREVGLLIRELIDIHTTTAAIDGKLFRQPGVLGSMVIGDKTTRLLDLYEITKLAHPDCLQNIDALQSGGASEARILLAEDSDFFRARMTEAIEAGGYEVVACPDGAEAWKTLQDPKQHFDMVVTDLEMPHVNGFELIRRIRQHPSVSHLPVFAVSSLASEEDQHRARTAGVDEYHIKLDRESLITAIRTRLKSVLATA